MPSDEEKQKAGGAAQRFLLFRLVKILQIYQGVGIFFRDIWN